jgi:hypothetical protein
MINEIDEAFYRNKRSALISSLALIGGTFTSIHIDNSGQILNAFKVDGVTSLATVVVLILVSSYLNLSYLLHYVTEIPEWRRSPESGLKQVEALRSAMIEMKEQAHREETGILRMREDAKNAVEKIADQISKINPHNLAASVESRAIKTLDRPTGAIYTQTFNQLSAAIRKDSQIQHVVGEYLKWDELAERIVSATRDKIIGTFHESCSQSLKGLQEDVDAALVGAIERATEANAAEDVRLKLLQEMSDRLLNTEGKLRRWVSAMNLRLKVQYLALPITLYLVAILYATANLSCGGALKGCRWMSPHF